MKLDFRVKEQYQVMQHISSRIVAYVAFSGIQAVVAKAQVRRCETKTFRLHALGTTSRLPWAIQFQTVLHLRPCFWQA